MASIPVVVVDHIEQAVRASIPEAVMHEVDAVDLVRTFGTEQGLLYPCRQPFLGPAPDVQAQTGVDPVDTLEVPQMTH
jgi:hypothetical protein